MKALCIIILMAWTVSAQAQDMYATASSRATYRFKLDTVPVTINGTKGFAVYNTYVPAIDDTFHVKGKTVRVGYTTISLVELYTKKKKYPLKQGKVGTRKKTFKI